MKITNRYVILLVILTSILLIFPGIVNIGCKSLDYDLPASVNPTESDNNPSKNLDGITLIGKYKSQAKRAFKQHKDTLVALSISGGGHRAANFALGVLSELENQGILKEIDYISTVSGGGFAAGVYITSLIDYIGKTGSIERYSFNEFLDNDCSIKSNLAKDYKRSLFWGFLLPTMWIPPHDRGELLEWMIDNRILGRSYRGSGKSLHLKDVFRYENRDITFDNKKMVPYWITNATVYNDGSRFPFAPDVLYEYGVCEYTHRAKRQELSESGLGIKDIPLSIGVTADNV